MKKILIILPNLPYPLNSGGNIGVYEMINELRYKVSVTLVVPLDSLDSYNELREIWSNVDFHYYQKKLSFKSKLINSFRKLSLLSALFLTSKEFGYDYSAKANENYRDSIYLNNISPNLIQVCTDLITRNKYSCVQIEFFKLLPLIKFLPKEENYIFVHHELRFVRLEREFSLLDNQNGLDSFYLSQIKGLEIELLKSYNKIVCLSEVDKKILSHYINQSKILVSPLTIRMNKNISSDYSFNNKLIFIGGSKHNPNVDGMKWFINNCWSNILEKYPLLKLEIIGEWSEEHKKIFNNYKNIIIHGFVKDLSVYFKNGIMVVPIRIGSGMRMKIIDAVNYRVPFVTTTIGIEGIDLVKNEDCFIADEANVFVSSIIELINSEFIQKKFIENSFNKLKNLYDADKLIEIRNEIYNI